MTGTSKKTVAWIMAKDVGLVAGVALATFAAIGVAFFIIAYLAGAAVILWGLSNGVAYPMWQVYWGGSLPAAFAVVFICAWYLSAVERAQGADRD